MHSAATPSNLLAERPANAQRRSVGKCVATCSAVSFPVYPVAPKMTNSYSLSPEDIVVIYKCRTQENSEISLDYMYLNETVNEMISLSIYKYDVLLSHQHPVSRSMILPT